jgi:hypothetical protein
MGTYIKPIQPTVVNNIQIIRDIVAQVRKKPAIKDIKWAKARRKLYKELTAKGIKYI